MKLGIFLMGSQDSSYFNVVDQVVEADALGFDGVWLAERHFASGDLLWPSPDARGRLPGGAARGASASAWRRACSPSTTRSTSAPTPATLDILSEGRLDLGLSRGSMDEAPHLAFGAPRDEARQRFDESFDVLRLFFRGRPFSYKGRFYDLADIIPSPASVQRPHPPIYMVANNPLSLDAAADQGLPVFMNGAMRLVDLGAGAGALPRACAAAGFDAARGRHPGQPLRLRRREPRPRAPGHARALPQFLERRAPDLRAYLAARFGERATSFELLAREVCIFDDPEGCAARLYELEDQAGRPPCALHVQPDHARPPATPSSRCAASPPRWCRCSRSRPRPRSSLRRRSPSRWCASWATPRGRPRAGQTLRVG